jgi:hypothetical protein
MVAPRPDFGQYAGVTRHCGVSLPKVCGEFEGVLLARLPFQVRKRIIDPAHESY